MSSQALWWSIFLQLGCYPCDAFHLGVMYPGADVLYLDRSRGGQDDEVCSLPVWSQFPLDLIFQAFVEDKGWYVLFCNCFSTKMRALSGPMKTGMLAKNGELEVQAVGVWVPHKLRVCWPRWREQDQLYWLAWVTSAFNKSGIAAIWRSLKFAADFCSQVWMCRDRYGLGTEGKV